MKQVSWILLRWDYDWDRKPGMDEWERKSIPFGSEETYNSVDAEAGGIDDIDVG